MQTYYKILYNTTLRYGFRLKKINSYLKNPGKKIDQYLSILISNYFYKKNYKYAHIHFMFKTFRKYILKNHLFDKNQSILLANSGGIDSMVMTDLFLKMNISIELMHCNFNLRGNESNADEHFVKKFAAENGIPIHIKRFNTLGYASEKKVSTQMAARNLRYEWFETLINETGFLYYATAHHQDDQIETFFINLFRGTGVSGLRGIPKKNGHCVRPLLFASRKMIEHYAQANNIKFREDSSNYKDNYLRNKIRHFILPAIEKSESNFRNGFQNTFNFLADAENFITNEIDKKRIDFIENRGDLYFISIEKIINEKNGAFVLFELLKPFNFNHPTVLNIIKSLKNQAGKRFLSPTYELVIDREHLIISEIDDEIDKYYEIDEFTNEIDEPLKIKFKKELLKKGKSIPANNNIAYLDFEKLRYPLKIRKYREGDKFSPLGMKGKKKLSDFFIDEKIPLPEKRNIWLLISGEDIAWIINYRIDDRFKISSNTTTALVVSLI